jgi:hypothetical protein
MTKPPRVPAALPRPRRRACADELALNLNAHPRCPFCRDEVHPHDAKQACLACMAWHHQACWFEHGRCSTCQAEHAAPRQCTAPDCMTPVNGVVTEPKKVNRDPNAQDLRLLCAPHAVQAIDQQVLRVRVSVALLLLLTAGSFVWALVMVAQDPGRADEDLLAVLLTCLLCGGGALVTAIQPGELGGLRKQLSQPPNPEPPRRRSPT